jgi:hypothetical protein
MVFVCYGRELGSFWLWDLNEAFGHRPFARLHPFLKFAVLKQFADGFPHRIAPSRGVDVDIAEVGRRRAPRSVVVAEEDEIVWLAHGYGNAPAVQRLHGGPQTC